jgi:hypothetical protein
MNLTKILHGTHPPPQKTQFNKHLWCGESQFFIYHTKWEAHPTCGLLRTGTAESSPRLLAPPLLPPDPCSASSCRGYGEYPRAHEAHEAGVQ